MSRYWLKTMDKNKDEIFAIWAPEDSLWSPWPKPVLFAHLDSALSYSPTAESFVDVSWSPDPAEKIALILDLPGRDGARLGLALAARGYRPVPLYNAIPTPFTARQLDPLTGRMVCAVDVLPILCALRQGAERLAQIALPPDAPPAFLLDANRHGDIRKMLPNEFDNRSVCFTTDFPSANFLQANGINKALLVQKNALFPQSDLAHTLRRWQDAGIVLERVRLDFPGLPERFEVSRPTWYGAMFQRALAALGLRRAKAGGFGAWVPEASASG